MVITGEIYETDETNISAVDRLEGHPHIYTRENIEKGFKTKNWYSRMISQNSLKKLGQGFESIKDVKFPDGSIKACFCYIMKEYRREFLESSFYGNYDSELKPYVGPKNRSVKFNDRDDFIKHMKMKWTGHS